jgi:hypothetical protein
LRGVLPASHPFLGDAKLTDYYGCLAAIIASEKLLVSECQRLNRQQFGSRGKILAALHGPPLVQVPPALVARDAMIPV